MNPAEYYILNQPEPYRTILLHLQMIIEQTCDHIELQYKWKVPFYYIKKTPFCYLNHTKDYVDLGFWNSAHLTKYHVLMNKDGRKVIKSLRYKSLADIDESILVNILQEDYAINDKKFYK